MDDTETTAAIHNSKPTSFVKNIQKFEYNSWTLASVSNHIMPSSCVKNCREEENPELCNFCLYLKELKLPHFPEMVFAENVLQLKHQRGFIIEFNALDALKEVDLNENEIKVAVAAAWQEANNDVAPNTMVKIKGFDWTYKTDYRGTILDESNPITIEATTDRINMEKLKRREKILFYQEIPLFEDELHDHGCASCSVKVRVMQSGFFVLLRYYLRVDDVLVQINDTRLYYEEGKNFVLREFTKRSAKVEDLKNIPVSVLIDPNELWQHLPLQYSDFSKINIPAKKGD